MDGEAENNCKRLYPGIINKPVNPRNPEVVFAKVRLQCVPKEDALQALAARATFPLNPFPLPGDNDADLAYLDYNSVRLCFQVLTEDPATGKPQSVCLAISEPIYDKKRFNSLEICRLTTHTGSVAGGTELTMLCKKVTRNDTEIRFFQVKAGKVVWEAFPDKKFLKFFKQVTNF